MMSTSLRPRAAAVGDDDAASTIHRKVLCSKSSHRHIGEYGVQWQSVQYTHLHVRHLGQRVSQRRVCSNVQGLGPVATSNTEIRRVVYKSQLQLQHTQHIPLLGRVEISAHLREEVIVLACRHAPYCCRRFCNWNSVCQLLCSGR